MSLWASGVNVMSNVDGVFPFGVETADETQFLAGLKDDSLLPPLSAREYVTWQKTIASVCNHKTSLYIHTCRILDTATDLDTAMCVV